MSETLLKTFHEKFLTKSLKIVYRTFNSLVTEMLWSNYADFFFSTFFFFLFLSCCCTEVQNNCLLIIVKSKCKTVCFFVVLFLFIRGLNDNISVNSIYIFNISALFIVYVCVSNVHPVLGDCTFNGKSYSHKCFHVICSRMWERDSKYSLKSVFKKKKNFSHTEVPC